MKENHPNPWRFHNSDKRMVSENGSYKVVYYDVNEIAMGGPLGGQCFLETSNNQKLKIHEWCGGPLVFEADGSRFAIPIWTRDAIKGTIQQLGIVDTQLMQLTVYERSFRVLDLHSFEKNTVYGDDSPLHETKAIIFDIESEPVLSVIPLGD